MKREEKKKKKIKPPLHRSSALKGKAFRKILEAKANSAGGFGREGTN